MVIDPAEVESAATLSRRAASSGCSVAVLRADVLARISDAVTPQGCAAIVGSRTFGFDALGDGDLVVLEDARDPGNLGAVVRVAEAAGAAGVVLAGSSADPFGPKALRASAGSTLRLPVVEGGALDAVLSHLGRRGMTTVATSSHGGEDFASFHWPHPMALVLGNEAHGLDPVSIGRCDRTVAIPLAEQVESLNLSVAAGILLFASARRLRSTKTPQGPSTMLSMTEGEG